jgi:hypothetical protein
VPSPDGARGHLVRVGGLRPAAPLLALVAIVFAVHVQSARAVILPAVTLDGPSEEIVGFGGVAMAEDGTGGVVYLKRVDGVAHVFVARYVNGEWLAPIRVDTEEPYAASWPRIGAADGGELVVVWATPYATKGNSPVDELLGATLGPGATGFGPAMLIDPEIGDGTGTSPDLAMSSTGFADVVYRAVTVQAGQKSPIPLLRPGDVVEQVRVAHFDGARWSRLGAINRDLGVSMRPPTQANAPQIAIGATGNGVVVWQEPEIEGVARIWARRLFGSTLDYVLPASATSFAGTPIETDADAPSVAVSRLGQAEVAYRQDVGPGSPLPGPRIFLNTLPNGEAESGAEFLGASVVDNEVAGGDSASIGAPSVDLDEKGQLLLLYDSNGTPRVIEGNDLGLTAALSLGPPFTGAGADQSAASVMNPEGGGVSAWASADPHGDPAVAVREDFPEGGVQTALISGGAGGEIGELAVGRSGLGDGLVAFRQGPIGHAAIVAAEVSAPPELFVVNVPHNWLKPSEATISWQPAASANAPISYQLVLDGHRQPVPAGKREMLLDTRGVGPGVHHVQVLATDAEGQSALTPPSILRLDDAPPTIKIARAQGGFAVSVRVSDAYSGLDANTVSVSFGDGHRATGKARYTHRYGHAGIYEVVVHAGDKLGVAGVVRKLVSVR